MAHLYNSQLDAYTLYHKNHESHSPSSSVGPALPALGHALAGSTGTAIANLAIYPLDLIITRLQVQRSLRNSSSANTPHASEYKGVLDAFEKIYNTEGGITAFYTGVLQDTGKSIADSFLFFLFYNYLRTNRLQKHGQNTTTLPALEELIVGALAGGCSKFFTTPISNIVTRKQTSSLLASRSSSPSSTSLSVSSIAQNIRDEKGLQGFWSGYSASLVLTLNPSLTFFLYEFFKRSFLPRAQRDDPGARVTFLMAAVSKAIASTITYPFSLAKARAQASASPPVFRETTDNIKSDVEKMDKDSSVNENERLLKAAAAKAKAAAKKNNVFMEILKIYRSEGVEALYEGVYGEILKGFFSHGITMLVKEMVHKLVIKTYFMILKALNKMPNPKQVVNQAGEKVKGGAEQAGNVLQGGYEKIREGAGVVGERAGVMGNNATEVASTGYKNAAEGLKEGVGAVGERMVAVSGDSKSASEGVKNATSTSKGAKGALDETAQKAGKVVGREELKSEDAGHLLGNAQEQLGEKVKGLGEGIKGEKGGKSAGKGAGEGVKKVGKGAGEGGEGW